MTLNIICKNVNNTNCVVAGNEEFKLSWVRDHESQWVEYLDKCYDGKWELMHTVHYLSTDDVINTVEMLLERGISVAF